LPGGRKAFRGIVLIQHFLYVCFILLWFKDNFSPLRKIELSYLFALAPLILVSLYRIFLKVRQKKTRIHLKISRETALLLVLLLLAIALRIPHLNSSYGIMNSDDAVMALMGKHISEGKTPPICFYGQRYLGSLSSHYYALFFQLFGYSILVLKCSTLLIFLAFMAANFFFLKEVFSYPFSVIATFFFSLPFPVLVRISLDNASAFPFVFLLGTLVIYLSYLISFKGQKEWLPCLGFLMGTAFWTHPLTASCILTGLLLLLIKTKFQVGRYARLLWFAILGFLPQLLLEISERLNLISFLSSGKSGPDWARLKTSLNLGSSMLSAGEHPSRYFFGALVFAGIIYLAYLSFRKRSFLAPTLFSVEFLFGLMLYVLSGFGSRGHIWYLYPLFLSFPVLMIAPFLAIRSPRVRHVLSAGLFLVLFVFYNLGASWLQVKTIKERHLRLAQLTGAMERTGQRYWYGEYWTAYLLTSISKEKVIVDSYPRNRYPLYSLAYSNSEEKCNHVFFRHYDLDQKRKYANLKRWLSRTGLPAKTEDVGKMHLVYDIQGRLYPPTLAMKPPSQVPEITLIEACPKAGFLYLRFDNRSPGQDTAFWLTARVPGFCSRRIKISLADREVRMALPLPESEFFKVRYFLDYSGVEIPSTIREIPVSFPASEIRERRDGIVFLQGFGPRVRHQDRPRTILEKVVRFEVNRGSPGDIKIRLLLHSPFDFSSWRWYRKLVQKVRIELNHSPFMELELQDGRNVVELPIPNSRRSGKGDIITLHFSYHIWFPSMPPWKTAAFLDKIDVN